MLRKLVKQYGLNQSRVVAMIWREIGKQRMKDLTKQEWAKIADDLETLKKTGMLWELLG